MISPDPAPDGTTAAQAAAQLAQVSAGLSSLTLQQDSYSVGINYTVTPGLKLKFQTTIYNGFGDSNGLFTAPAGVSVGDEKIEYMFMVNMVY